MGPGVVPIAARGTAGFLRTLVTQPVSLVMERKMLLGIKQRAERLSKADDSVRAEPGVDLVE
ncbi:hypothetical protein AB0M95_20915 [Sphaerisporangium sp. NPDC051017]|uniref:hypothetical protein n=1 Tax=Sphaerisporangium sp. NPDC051017 TaxID=3154636 RepID=UPI00342ED7B6